jgi:hypothetical protein
VSGRRAVIGGRFKFDNSALIDAKFENMRCFAPARHLMPFGITPLMMLLMLWEMRESTCLLDIFA